MSTERFNTAVRAFHQGTFHGQEGKCPLCGVELTFIHLPWECTFWDGKVPALPAQWVERLKAGTEPELWNRGMTQSIFYIPDGGMATFNGEGLLGIPRSVHLASWTCCFFGHCTNLQRSQTRFAFAICIHHIQTQERVGSLTGICPGQATRLRALFYGLKHMSLHLRDKVRVAVFNQAIWNAWNPWAAYEKFPDLSQGLEQEDFAQIKLLLFQLPGLKKSLTSSVTSMKTHETSCVWQEDAWRFFFRTNLTFSTRKRASRTRTKGMS